MTESHGLQTVEEHSADAHEAVTIAQQREDFAAGGCRDMDGGKLLVAEEVQQQAGVTPIVFLPPAGRPADGPGAAPQQINGPTFQPEMEPPQINGNSPPHPRRAGEPWRKTPPAVPHAYRRC